MWNVGPPGIPAPLTARFQLDPEWLLLASALAGLVLLGVFVIARLRRWQAAQRSTDSPLRLEDYRALMEQGLLDPAEFERIRGLFEKPDPTRPPDN